MTAWTPEGAEERACVAAGRMRAALVLIEEAQHTLERAAQAMSPVIGGAVDHKRVMALRDKVRTEWYRVKGRMENRKGAALDLDRDADGGFDDPWLDIARVAPVSR